MVDFVDLFNESSCCKEVIVWLDVHKEAFFVQLLFLYYLRFLYMQFIYGHPRFLIFISQSFVNSVLKAFGVSRGLCFCLLNYVCIQMISKFQRIVSTQRMHRARVHALFNLRLHVVSRVIWSFQRQLLRLHLVLYPNQWQILCTSCNL